MTLEKKNQIQKFDELMIKKLGLYRIGESGIYIKFPPHDNLREDLKNTVLKTITLTLMLEDPVFNSLLVNKLTEDSFESLFGRMIDCFGDVWYISPKSLGEMLPNWLANYGTIGHIKYYDGLNKNYEI